MRYKVVVLPIDCEEEWEPDKELQTGIECDGVFMITFVNGKASEGIGMHISVEELKEAMKSDCPEILMARAACAMAEAEMKAVDLMRQADAYETRGNMEDLLSSLGIRDLPDGLKGRPGIKIIKIKKRLGRWDPEEGEDE